MLALDLAKKLDFCGQISQCLTSVYPGLRAAAPDKLLFGKSQNCSLFWSPLCHVQPMVPGPQSYMMTVIKAQKPSAGQAVVCASVLFEQRRAERLFLHICCFSETAFNDSGGDTERQAERHECVSNNAGMFSCSTVTLAKEHRCQLWCWRTTWLFVFVLSLWPLHPWTMCKHGASADAL